MNSLNRKDIAIISVTVAVILLFRIMYIDYYQSLIVRYDFNIGDVFNSFVGNIIVLLLSMVLDIIGVWYLSKIRPYGQNSIARFLYDMVLIIAVSTIGVLILDYNVLFQVNTPYRGYYFLFAELTIFLFNASFVYVMDVVYYALRVRNTILNERLQRRQAVYQYHKMKEQLNPHFLFNSLNMLEYLVQSQETDRASLYIRKLARIYRYLLQTQDMELTTIDDELEFVSNYVDLQQVRFPEGIILKVDIPQIYMSKQVIPCGLQLLVENAIKHNKVSKLEPLLINIYVEDNYLVVANNIQLKLSVDESMNVGLNNVRGQYVDITGKQVEIVENEDEFIVKLPII